MGHLRLARFLVGPLLAAAAVPPARGAPPEFTVETVVAAEFPVAIAWAPAGTMYFTERSGVIMAVHPGSTSAQEALSIDVRTQGETGLLGLEIDPEFEANNLLYFFYTRPNGRNVVARYRAGGGACCEEILTGLASGLYHNGGILEFARDGTLFVSTGEAHNPRRAQDPNDIGGKILRLRGDGSPPGDNPFGAESKVYAMGIRNAFGLAVDPVTGDLWESENGPAGNDEVNRIVAGKNYGWPDEQCSGRDPGLEDAAFCFRETIVPTDIDFLPKDPPPGRQWLDPELAGDLFLGSFRGSVRRFDLSEDRHSIVSHEVFHEEASGVVGVFYGPDGNLYLATVGAIKRIVLTGPAPSPPPSPSPALSPAAQPTPPQERGRPGLLVLLGAAVLAVVAALAVARARRLK